MTAKEMFEKLGFKNESENTYLLPYSMDGVGLYICFNGGTVFMQGVGESQKLDSSWVVMTKEVYDAITQKKKELGDL